MLEEGQEGTLINGTTACARGQRTLTSRFG